MVSMGTMTVRQVTAESVSNRRAHQSMDQQGGSDGPEDRSRP
jgi:hypothetical protein